MAKVDTKKIIAQLDSLADVNALLRIVKKLDDAGRQILIEAIGGQLSDGKKQQVLALLRGQILGQDKALRDWLTQSINKVYVAGMNQANKLYSVATGKAVGAKITVSLLTTTPNLAPHLQAVNALLSDAYLNFGKTMDGYIKGAETILNDALKRQIRSNIAQGRLEGAAIKEIKATVKDAFVDRGFTVLVDRGGRQWTLDRYSEMLAKTQIIDANNEGVVNRASDFGVDIVEISDHGATDDACQSQEGKIYSISGNSDNYPPLAGNEPPFHPNCGHTLLLRPDLH